LHGASPLPQHSFHNRTHAKDGEVFIDAPSSVFIGISPILRRTSGSAKIGLLNSHVRGRGIESPRPAIETGVL
jgi:hypothetical protein